MAADALESGSPANNPRSATADEIVALYREAYEEGSATSAAKAARLEDA